jgi:hypothetical protein
MDVAFKQGDMSKDIPVQPGDLVYIPSRKRSHNGNILQYLSPLSTVLALTTHL